MGAFVGFVGKGLFCLVVSVWAMWAVVCRPPGTLERCLKAHLDI
jgi:hypothetical protein